MDFFLYVLKKVVSQFFYPLQLAGILWLAGVIIWILRPRSRKGIALVLVSGIWLLVMSLPLTSFSLLKPLERMAGPYADPEDLSRKGVQYIVVLGGDIRAGDLTPADRVANTSLVRVMEGIRLWKGVQGSRLVVSGGSEHSDIMTTGEAMSILALNLGIPKEAIVVEDLSLDTEQEAKLLKPMLDKSKFALVTSASHMNRALMHFRRAGLDPIPAPSDFRLKKFKYSVTLIFPGLENLGMSQQGIHEYVGTLFLILKQRGYRGMQPLSG
ncbi:MAG: YdcF family protein [Desulfomonile tiedjei]|uniref:YdcF family protein n=1 Tax=Desulfomonile tiedjei TaxID=2358 RepID=A0A9D6Z4C4_9BACT|nr:YdcF family protein [Desulfomonile tiedjei]